MTYHLDDIAGFREWLEAKDPDTVVGQAVESCDCPLANYLNDKFDGGPFQVNGFNFGPLGFDSDAAPLMPNWSVLFLDTVDLADVGSPVTARRALNILREVEAVHGH